MWEQHLAGKEIGLEIGRSGFDPSRPSLLMVHGSGGRAAGFRPQLSLMRGANLAAIDMPGHGATPGPGLTTVTAMADWLADFLAAGPIRPVLLGHSLGGAVVQTLALARPELISGLVLFGTGSRLKVLPAIIDGLEKDPDATFELIISFAYSDEADANLKKLGVAEMKEAGPATTRADFLSCNSFDVSGRLGEIKAPTLVLVGEKDKLTPVKYAQALVNGIPGATLAVAPGGGHMLNVENPAGFNQAVAEFMAKF